MKVDAKNLQIVEETSSASKVGVLTSSTPPSKPPQGRIASSVQEENTKSKNSPSQSNSKLIGSVLVGVVIIGVGIFLFIGSDKGGKAPVASSPPVESKGSPIVTPPVSEPQPAPQVKVEPPIAEPAKTPTLQPSQQPKSNNQQNEAPVVMPDLNKLVKDAINK
jgi:hypothetical protein